VLENILARQKGFNELAFSGTILNFRRIRFGSSTKKIKENPDEIYRMVRGSLRGLMYVSDKNNKDTWLDMIAKHWSVRCEWVRLQRLASGWMPFALVVKVRHPWV
jgi:hypothetical protein